MGNIFDLDLPARITGFARCVPSPVRQFEAVALGRGRLVLRWQPPRGAMVRGYWIERTREGRAYELLAEITGCWINLDSMPGEPWFYRVRAFNAKGPSAFRLVWFYRRTDRFTRGGHNADKILMPVAVRPGLQVNICE